jgi:hypothetical protein
MKADIKKLEEIRKRSIEQMEAANIEVVKSYVRNMTENEKAEIVKLCSTKTLVDEISRRSKITAKQLDQMRAILSVRQSWEA